MRRLRRDQGSVTVEYLGVLVAVVALLSVLAVSGIGLTARRATEQTVCDILGDASCAPGPAVVPPPVALPAESGTSALGQVGGFFAGAGSQLRAIVRGIGETAAWIGRTVTSAEQRRENARLWATILDDPGAALRAVWDGATEPIREDWAAGRYGSAVGRGVVEVLGVVAGGKGVHQLRHLRFGQPLLGGGRLARASDNVAAIHLARRLLGEEVASLVFRPDGHLKPEVIAASRQIVEGADLRNQRLIRLLTRDGSHIEDWEKRRTPTYSSPSGNFDVHFYYNVRTGAVYYDLDYKSVFHGSRYESRVHPDPPVPYWNRDNPFPWDHGG